MKMIAIKYFTNMPVEKLKGLNEGDRIELLTYKKDRKVSILKYGDHLYRVEEDGFEKKTFDEIGEAQLPKLLKQLQRIEFPRSNIFFMNIIPAVREGY